MGKILTNEFELPNIKDKAKKTVFKQYVYDLTDKHRGAGQILDKKATLKKIVETNIGLGRLKPDNIDPTKFIVPPRDRVYKILSREKEYESQAVVFFVRDYSGSMHGDPTRVVCSQHLMIYSWLMYQYQNNVKTRFILHDSDAKEVPDFYTYHNLKVAGGTRVVSAYRLVNQIVEEENLAKDYNIYVFHGTDGDDWDDGTAAIPEIQKILSYASRMGVTIAMASWGMRTTTSVEDYIRKSGLLESHPSLLRLDTMKAASADEGRIIEGIKTLVSP